MKVFLIARYRHHERYFATLAARCDIPMQVFTLNTLPWLKPAFWRCLRRVDARALIAGHLATKSRKLGKRNALFWHLYQAANAARAALAYAQFCQLLHEQRPDGLVMWNGGNWFLQAAALAAREQGIPVFYGENGLLPNTTTLDPQGVNFNNAMPRDAAFYRALPDEYTPINTTLVPRTSARSEQARAVTLPPRYVFVPFQVNTDSQIVFNSPWIRDMVHLLEVLQAVVPLLADPALVFVVKEHPSCKFRYDTYYDKVGDRIVFANGNNTQALIQGAEAVITVNSTVGLEALLLDRRVIVIGNAFFAIPGLVLEARSEAALAAAVNQLPTWQPDPVLRRQFLGYLSGTYCIPGSWKDPDDRHVARVAQRLRNVLEHGLPL